MMNIAVFQSHVKAIYESWSLIACFLIGSALNKFMQVLWKRYRNKNNSNPLGFTKNIFGKIFSKLVYTAKGYISVFFY